MINNKNEISHEASFLLELSGDISNFKDGFKGKVRHTYVLSPEGSSVFGFHVEDGVLYVGVPSELFDAFMNVRWYLANIIKDSPGIYLVFEMGIEPNNHPTALRIYLRKRRVNALLDIKRAVFVKMNHRGVAFNLTSKTSFDMMIRVVDGLDWEKSVVAT